MRPCRRVLLLAGLLLLPWTAPAPAQTPSDTDRLVRVAKLWGTVRFLHPYLAYREIDWEEALVKAIPKVRSARTSQEYAGAVREMLATLGDPATRVWPVPAQPSPAEPSGKAPPLYRWLDGSTLFVHFRPDVDNGMTYEQFEQSLQKLRGELPRASRVVVDIRSLWGIRFRPAYALGNFESLLISKPVDPPAQRYVFHSGYRDQTGNPSLYFSGFQTPAVDRILPEPGLAPRRVVFLVNADTVVPPIAAALQASGDGAIVSEGPLSDGQFVRQRTVDLGEGFQAWVRVSEVLLRPGWPGLHADAEAAGDDALLAAALRWLQKRPERPGGAAVALPEFSWRPDPRRDGMVEPSLEYRLLAVIKLWNVFHDFFPYLSLTGDWDAVLPEFLARMEGVKDGREYALAMAEMAARANDGHVTLAGNPTLDALYGAKPAPVAVRWIENAWVVTQVGEPASGSGLEVGDVLLTLDGRPVAEREAELRSHLAAATEAGMHRKIADRLLSGADGSELALTVRGRGDKVREARLKRQAWTPGFSGETVRILPGNLGYVDLSRLTIPEVDALFEKVKDTRALILDMRGYPNGTAWFLAPRLNTCGALYGAIFRRPWVSGLENGLEPAGVVQPQRLPTSDAPKYAGRTVMLIDERTVSQSEHTGLFLEMASGTKFIGTQTAGTNGDITFFSLPGIASVRFSGQEVRHADGRQLQRIGLVPDVPAAPTIQGIRDGKDEVLDRAVRYLTEELGKTEAGSPEGPADAPGSSGGNASR